MDFDFFWLTRILLDVEVKLSIEIQNLDEWLIRQEMCIMYEIKGNSTR